jgi:hypothetical protein
MDQLDTLCVLKEKFELDALQVSLMPTMSLEQSIEGEFYLSFTISLLYQSVQISFHIF